MKIVSPWSAVVFDPITRTDNIFLGLLCSALFQINIMNKCSWLLLKLLLDGKYLLIRRCFRGDWTNGAPAKNVIAFLRHVNEKMLAVRIRTTMLKI